VQWDLRGERPEGQQGGRGFGGNRTPVAEPGVYRVTLTVAGTEYSTTVNVLEDIWLEQR
jgi:hypothetical protein